MIVAEKTPDGVLDYTIDWRPWLKAGRVLDTVTATYTAGVTQPPTKPPTNDDYTSTFWVQGGTVGSREEVVLHAIDDDAREDDLSVFIDIVERL